MSRNTSNESNGGIGFVGILTVVFIVLKLIGDISWSWWWVTKRCRMGERSSGQSGPEP